MCAKTLLKEEILFLFLLPTALLLLLLQTLRLLHLQLPLVEVVTVKKKEKEENKIFFFFFVVLKKNTQVLKLVLNSVATLAKRFERRIAFAVGRLRTPKESCSATKKDSARIWKLLSAKDVRFTAICL